METKYTYLPAMDTLRPRKIKRICTWCECEYTCWGHIDDPDGICSEKCEKAKQEWDKACEGFFHD